MINAGLFICGCCKSNENLLISYTDLSYARISRHVPFMAAFISKLSIKCNMCGFLSVLRIPIDRIVMDESSTTE